MLIGIDASRYRHPQPTGVEVYSDEIIDGLLEHFKRQKRQKLRLYTSKKLPNVSTKLQKLIPAKRLWTQWHFARELVKNPPDVIFIPSHVIPLRLTFLKQNKTKIVTTIHDVAFKEFPSAYSFFQTSYLELSARIAVKHAHKIIVPSEATKKDLIRLYKCSAKKLVVIPHGFRPPKYDISPKKESTILKRFHLTKSSPYIFFVGRLEAKKNLARLIQAYMKFREKHPDWQLILGGGRGVGFRAILTALEKEQILRHVVMPGYLTEDEKHVLLRYAHVFAFPSLSEGFGLPVLEAAAHGTPILASKIPALLEFDELVDEYVNPLNVSSITKGLERIARRTKFKTKHKEVSKYSWSKCSKSVWDVLTSKK
jgi:glycosyltransferase involved in cell wall biosynthesis